MPDISVRGIKIKFPFTPYKCQLDYMDKVIQALEEGKNALLESPTGTGKTLCLLCATLAWQDHFIDNNQQNIDINWGSKTDKSTQGSKVPSVIPRIIYSSRTHSQLSQCMKALKNTEYRKRKVSIIASRDQLCINNSVNSLETTSAKIFGCRIRIKGRSCHYYNNYDKSRDKFIRETSNLVDIEDLVSNGRTNRCCPYFLSRDLQDHARIIFMPYNYLLDPRVRRSHGIDLENSVIIFDEAHNVEHVCEDSASVDLTSTQIALCIEELKKLGEYLFQSLNNDLFESEEKRDDDKPELESVLLLKECLIKLEESLQSLSVDKDGITEKPIYLMNMLSEAGINVENCEIKLEVLECCEKYIGMSHENATTKQIGVKGLGAVSSFIRTVMCEDNGALESLASSYRVHIRDGEPGNAVVNKGNVWEAKKPAGNVRTLSFWCLTPGRAMSLLVRNYHIRNVVLTSGTLFPVEGLKMDMKIDFELELRNNHVINPDQLLVTVCTKGPDATPLNSSYEFREDASYNSSLGNSIVNLAKFIPNGVLVVFPSYSMMRKCVEKWQNSDIYNRLIAHKQVIIEPQDKLKFTLAMQQFDAANCGSDSGAMLLAVARGKVSEGLDLSNEQGRGVIIVGLPFPAMLDPRIRLKMQFLDEQVVVLPAGDHRMSGRAWYKQQAYRAVNQSLGRVIRHSRDFGAVYLCDERFASSYSRAQLPAWVHSSVRVCNEFGPVIRLTTQFFKTIPSKYPTAAVVKESLPPLEEPTPEISQIIRKTTTIITQDKTKSDSVILASQVQSFCHTLSSEGIPDVLDNYSQVSEEPTTSQLSLANPPKNLMQVLQEQENSLDDEPSNPVISRAIPSLDRKRTLAEITDNTSVNAAPKKKYKLITKQQKENLPSIKTDKKSELTTVTNKDNMQSVTDLNKSNSLKCSRCSKQCPPAIPLAAPCKHVCCFQCWRQIIEGNTADNRISIVTKCCPVCGQLVKRRHLVKLTATA